MPIKFIKPSDRQQKDDLLGELVSGTGRVPDYIDFGSVAIRSDDKVLAQQIADLFGGEFEENEGKRPYYAVLPESVGLDIQASFIRTQMTLRSRNDGSVLRACDGEVMKDDEGKEHPCACLAQFEYGSDEWNKASKENLACKPAGLIYFTIPGIDTPGNFIFSKNSGSTVNAFIDLEGQLPEELPEGGFETTVTIKNVTSKKTGYSWSVPEFSAPVLGAPGASE